MKNIHYANLLILAGSISAIFHQFAVTFFCDKKRAGGVAGEHF
jgi:hypothetical protein